MKKILVILALLTAGTAQAQLLSLTALDAYKVKTNKLCEMEQKFHGDIFQFVQAYRFPFNLSLTNYTIVNALYNAGVKKGDVTAKPKDEGQGFYSDMYSNSTAFVFVDFDTIDRYTTEVCITRRK